MATLSVIIATYNRAGLLARALEGILAQTRPVDEIIIVDDASVDGTADLVRRLASRHPTVTYLRNETNVGPAESRCRALERCTSDLVVFHDDDDVWTDSEFVESALTHMGTGIVCVSANAHYVRADGTVLPADVGVSGRVGGAQFLLDIDARYRKPLSTFTSVFRRSALVASGILDSRVVNDYALYLRALTQGDIYVMRQDVGAYVRHDTAISEHMDFDLMADSLRERFAVSHRMSWSSEDRRRWNERQFMVVYRFAMLTSLSPARCLRMVRLLVGEVGLPTVRTCLLLVGVPVRAALGRLRARLR